MKRNPNGHDYEYRMIKASEIKFDTYQRPLNESQVHSIVREFNGDAFNAPKVSFRDGCYWGFDGRQSTTAWQTYHKNLDEPIECKVFYGMTWEDEVDAFLFQSGFSKNVANTWKIRAKYMKKDPDVVDMVRIVRKLGWDVDFENSKVGDPEMIQAVNAIYQAYMKLGSVAFEDMMTALREAYGSCHDAVTVQMITGMKVFYKTFYGQFKHVDLVSSLKHESPMKIIRDAKAIFYNGSNKYALQICRVYNYKRRNKLDENKL